MNTLKNWIKKEIVLVIASCLALLSSFFTGLHTSHIDFNVLMLLFNLMIVVAAFKKLNVLDKISTLILSRCQNTKQLTLGLMLLTFFMAMIITNDVALITFVPLALILVKSTHLDAIKLIVLLTLAANLGSSLTPIGNPQNLYLYSYYHLSPSEFLKITFPLGLMSFALLLVSVLRDKKEPLQAELSCTNIEQPTKVLAYSFLLGIILMSVFHLIKVEWTFILTLLFVLISDRSLFKKVDYALLITFIAFFVFIGNISSIPALTHWMQAMLQTEPKTYLAGILSSQIISNVPAAILLSTFTPYAKLLLIGVNIGGLGTLIASLASVISYKLFAQTYPNQTAKYLKVFTLYNVSLLFILTLLFLISL